MVSREPSPISDLWACRRQLGIPDTRSCSPSPTSPYPSRVTWAPLNLRDLQDSLALQLTLRAPGQPLSYSQAPLDPPSLPRSHLRPLCALPILPFWDTLRPLPARVSEASPPLPALPPGSRGYCAPSRRPSTRPPLPSYLRPGCAPPLLRAPGGPGPTRGSRPRHPLSREDPTARPTLHTSSLDSLAARRPRSPRHAQAASTPPHLLRAPAAPALPAPAAPRLPRALAQPGRSGSPRATLPRFLPSAPQPLGPHTSCALRRPLAQPALGGPSGPRPAIGRSPEARPHPRSASRARVPQRRAAAPARLACPAAGRKPRRGLGRLPFLRPAPAPRGPLPAESASPWFLGWTFNLYPARSRVNVCSGPEAWAQGQPAAQERPRLETYPRGQRHARAY